VIVVSNASPLITLSRIGQFDLLRGFFGKVHIAIEVHREVVILAPGRPGAEAVRAANWIEVHAAADTAELEHLRRVHPLGSGELATLLLATTLRADLAIIDERAARRLALAKGLAVIGCVGILERGYRRGMVKDLRGAYGNLLASGIYIRREILNRSLASLRLPGL
jgi:predicted nucleic acid-binding protein